MVAKIAIGGKLKKICFSIFLSVISINCFAVQGLVDYVIDGDTFNADVIIEDDISVPVRIRILDIDAPEIKGKCDTEIDLAIKSEERLKELLPEGSIVYLDNLKDDKYLGRINATVKNSDGVNVSDVLIKEKLAVPYDGGKRIDWCK